MRKIFLFVAALCCSAAMWAADFSAVAPSSQTLYFNIVDAGNHTCQIVAGDTYPEGDLVIPATVINPDDSELYTIVGIGNRAFKDCSSLTSVTFPTAATFTTIGDRAFFQAGITSVTIPDNITVIEEQAFRASCISSVTIGTGITTIPNSMFYDCYYLKRVVFPNHITGMEEGVFSGSAVKYVELGNAIADGFNAWAFGYDSYYWSKSQIDTIVINTVTPPTVTNSFYPELASRAILYVPVGSKADYKAADGWKDFKNILEIGEELVIHDITVSGGYTSDLEQASFEVDGVAMGSSNFSFKCTDGNTFTIKVSFGNPYYGLKKVMFGETDVTDQFNASNEATLTATATATLAFSYEQKIHPYDFAEEVASSQTLYFKILDAVNHKVAICNQTGGRSTSGNISVSYDGNTTRPAGALVIPTAITHEAVEYTIEEIDTLAFNGCYELTSLIIPEGIKAIRAGAFHSTYLGTGTELVIPQSCTVIEHRAFRDCRYNAVNPGGAEVIGEYAFLYCPLTEIKSTSALRELGPDICQADALTKVGLGENVEFVAAGAFYACPNIETVTILATTPPAVKYSVESVSESTSWSGFDPSGKTLYVPKSEGSTVLAAYQAANCWKLFGTISEIPEIPSALDNTEAAVKATKRIVNGQLFIERDGKTFNAQGIEVK